MKLNLVDGPYNLSARQNMLYDYELIKKVKEKNSVFLRIYKFKRPAITYGYFQKIENVVNYDYVKKYNIDLAKRKTGGRAFFHYDDFTYAFCYNEKMLKNFDALKFFAEVFKEIFEKINLPVFVEKKTRNYRSEDLCAFTKVESEIKIDGKKLIGVARLKKGDIIMQHGSLNFNFDYEIASKVFKTLHEKEFKQKLKNTFTFLGAYASLTFEELKQEFIERVKVKLNVY